MKFKRSFQLRDVCGEHVLLATSAELVDFNRLVTLNDTAFDIYQEFADKEFQLSEVEAFLMQHYEGATAEVVAADVARLFQEFQQEGLLLS